MRSTIGLISVFLLSCSSISKRYLLYTRSDEPMVINSRIGHSLEHEEAESLGVFKNIPGFISATFYKINEGGYEVLINTDAGNYKAVNRDAYGSEILQDFFNDPNRFGISEDKPWQIIDYDEQGFPISALELSLNRDKFGAMLSGSIIGCFSVFAPTIIVIKILPQEETPPSSDDIGPLIPETPAGICCLLGMCGAVVSTPAGCIISNNRNRNKALKFIKESRRPVKIE